MSISTREGLLLVQKCERHATTRLLAKIRAEHDISLKPMIPSVDVPQLTHSEYQHRRPEPLPYQPTTQKRNPSTLRSINDPCRRNLPLLLPRKLPNTHQLVVETRAHYRTLTCFPSTVDRLHVTSVVHTLVLFELGQHAESPFVP